MAIALRFDCNFDKTVAGTKERTQFNMQIQKDVSTALGIPEEAIEVLCHQRGSVIAEIILKKVNSEGTGTVRSAAALADELAKQATDKNSSFRKKEVGKLAVGANIHGPIAQAMCDIISTIYESRGVDIAKCASTSDPKIAAAVAETQHRLKQQADHAMRRMFHIQLAGAFDSFHDRVVETKKKHETCRGVVLRMQHLALAGAFDMLSGRVEQLKGHRRMVQRAVRRWKKPSLQIGLDKWLEYMDIIKYEVLEEAKEQLSQQVETVKSSMDEDKESLGSAIQAEKERRVDQAQRIVQRMLHR